LQKFFDQLISLGKQLGAGAFYGAYGYPAYYGYDDGYYGCGYYSYGGCGYRGYPATATENLGLDRASLPLQAVKRAI